MTQGFIFRSRRVTASSSQRGYGRISESFLHPMPTWTGYRGPVSFLSSSTLLLQLKKKEEDVEEGDATKIWCSYYSLVSPCSRWCSVLARAKADSSCTFLRGWQTVRASWGGRIECHIHDTHESYEIQMTMGGGRVEWKMWRKGNNCWWEEIERNYNQVEWK